MVFSEVFDLAEAAFRQKHTKKKKNTQTNVICLQYLYNDNLKVPTITISNI